MYSYYTYNLWSIIPVLTSVNTIDVTYSFEHNYVHEFVLRIPNNIRFTDI